MKSQNRHCELEGVEQSRKETNSVILELESLKISSKILQRAPDLWIYTLPSSLRLTRSNPEMLTKVMALAPGLLRPFQGFARPYLLFGLISLFPGDVQAITLKEALQSAINTHPQVMAERASSEANKATINREYAAFYPSIDLTAQGGLAYVREDYLQNSLQAAIAGESRGGTSSPSVTFKQLLYDGGSTVNQVKKATADFQQAYGKYLETVDGKGLRAAIAYIQVRRLQRLEKLTHQNIAVHKRILKKIAQLVHQGELTETDQTQVQARLDDAQVSLALVQGQLDVAKADFIEAVGKVPEHLSSPMIPTQFLRPQLNQTLQEALRKNKSLQAAKADIHSAKATLEVTKARSLPTVTFEADATRNQNVGGVRGVQFQSTALVVLRYNLIDGGADEARRQEARERVTESGKRLAVQRLALEQEVRSSWVTKESATHQVNFLRKTLKAKSQVSKAYEQQFLVGLRSLLDILNSYRDYFESEGEKITAEATEDLMKARLLTASSSLLKTFQIPLPKAKL